MARSTIIPCRPVGRERNDENDEKRGEQKEEQSERKDQEREAGGKKGGNDKQGAENNSLTKRKISNEERDTQRNQPEGERRKQLVNVLSGQLKAAE